MNKTLTGGFYENLKEIGVTKQAVYYRINRPPLLKVLQSLVSKENGVLTVFFDGEKLIKQVFLNDECQTNVSKENTYFDSQISVGERSVPAHFVNQQTNNSSLLLRLICPLASSMREFWATFCRCTSHGTNHRFAPCERNDKNTTSKFRKHKSALTHRFAV